MKFSPRQYAESLLATAKTATKQELGNIVEQFIKVLVSARQFKFVNKIVEHLEELIRNEDGVTKVTVEGINKMDKFTREQILEFLDKGEDEVEFEEKINPLFLGGVKIRLKDLLIDATLSGQLEKLRQNLR